MLGRSAQLKPWFQNLHASEAIKNAQYSPGPAGSPLLGAPSSEHSPVLQGQEGDWCLVPTIGFVLRACVCLPPLCSALPASA